MKMQNIKPRKETNMKIKQLNLSNFCQFIGDYTFNFSHRTQITGMNAVGKSTLKTAIMWLFNAKAENGKEIGGLRPHDKDGQPIECGDTTAELVTDTVTLKKIQKQSKSGSVTTKYLINGFEKKAVEFNTQIGELIVQSVCVSATDFFNLDTAKRKALLIDTFGNITVSDIIALFPEFSDLAEDLSVASINEIKKKYATKIKELTASRDKVVAEIGFNRQIAEQDIAEKELLINSLNEQIESISTKQSDIATRYAEQEKQTKAILDLQFEKSELIRKANEDNIKARHELESLIADNETLISKAKRDISDEKYAIEGNDRRIADLEKLRSSLGDKYKAISNSVFDENSLVCQYCGQEYPIEKKDQLRAEFEAHRKSDMEDLKTQGFEVKDQINTENENKKQHEQTIAELEHKIEALQNKNADYGMSLANIPNDVDTSDMPGIAQISSQIAEMEQTLKSMANSDNERTELASKRDSLISQKTTVENEIKAIQNAQAKVDELTSKQVELSQQIADCDRMLNLATEFDRKRCAMIEKSINDNFEYINFKLFEVQVNGELKDVCKVIDRASGENYEGNLNLSNRILAQIDISRAFQKALGVSLPIIVDNAESINEWRIPDTEQQLILIQKTDNKVLEVREMV